MSDRVSSRCTRQWPGTHASPALPLLLPTSRWQESYNHLASTGHLVVYGFHSNVPKASPWLSPAAWAGMALGMARLPRFDPMDLVTTSRSVAGFNLSFFADEAELIQRCGEGICGERMWCVRGSQCQGHDRCGARLRYWPSRAPSCRPPPLLCPAPAGTLRRLRSGWPRETYARPKSLSSTALGLWPRRRAAFRAGCPSGRSWCRSRAQWRGQGSSSSRSAGVPVYRADRFRY